MGRTLSAWLRCCCTLLRSSHASQPASLRFNPLSSRPAAVCCRAPLRRWSFLPLLVALASCVRVPIRPRRLPATRGLCPAPLDLLAELTLDCVRYSARRRVQAFSIHELRLGRRSSTAGPPPSGLPPLARAYASSCCFSRFAAQQRDDLVFARSSQAFGQLDQVFVSFRRASLAGAPSGPGPFGPSRSRLGSDLVSCLDLEISTSLAS